MTITSYILNSKTIKAVNITLESTSIWEMKSNLNQYLLVSSITVYWLGSKLRYSVWDWGSDWIYILATITLPHKEGEQMFAACKLNNKENKKGIKRKK